MNVRPRPSPVRSTYTVLSLAEQNSGKKSKSTDTTGEMLGSKDQK